MDPLAFSEERFRPSLEERLESIISGAALMADSSCTRDDRRERIVAECNSVRQALQDLLSEYMGNVSVLPFHFILLVTTSYICIINTTALLISFCLYRTVGQNNVISKDLQKSKKLLIYEVLISAEINLENTTKHYLYVEPNKYFLDEVNLLYKYCHA